MSFLRSTMDVGLTPPIEYHPGTGLALGDALTMTAGALMKCAATTAPSHIAVGPSKDGVTPVIKAQKYMIFEVPLSAEGTELKPGNKVTIGADAQTVTATTTSGVAEIVAMEGTAVGDIVKVRF